MSASRTRAYLRKLRQQRNLTSLTHEEKKQSINAVRNFIIFGGKRGHGNGANFSLFVNRFPLLKDKVEIPRKPSRRDLYHRFARIHFIKAILKRRARNKRAREQRARV